MVVKIMFLVQDLILVRVVEKMIAKNQKREEGVRTSRCSDVQTPDVHVCERPGV